ncbi:KdsC family phosphatase [Sphingobacterium hungaricum]|uniref:3-deoxy-D-manno-octulosonate 8-phosphate phosphatase n=1 Tax=Sphingobacterium hungaricum TaxID=2082723 RepID=A0A928YPV0_9SPHI|nr:HAD hydrolase family protein [Sphingobacterium hungaricum]MBE8713279.1 3-deoxy-D-manno-octulosonate 8-phosphate phosphatase [Sphingobacterium hungaricum]
MVYEEFAKVTAIILDVDGVLTDGVIQVNEEGHQLRAFQVKDGYAIQLAVKSGVFVFAISGAKSNGVKMRLEGLGVEEIHLGISDKVSVLDSLVDKYNLDKATILYMGDDIPDYYAMQEVGLPVCPSDAVEEIKAISKYVSSKSGGNGAVRDVIEKVLKLQGKWFLDDKIKSI